MSKPVVATAGRLLTKPWLLCLLLVSLGFVVRMPALQGQLLWDDQFLARDNPFIKSPLLILEAFRHYLFLDSLSAHYRPVQNLSFTFDYLIWNTDTYGFHLTNVILHLLGGVMLFLLLRRLFHSLATGKNGILLPWLVASLWVVHPVHSAAIDYISGRADSLAFVFACSAWLLFYKGREAKRPIIATSAFLGSALLGLLALCSREIALIWIALFLLHMLVWEKSVGRKLKLYAVTGCFVLALGYLGLRHLPEKREQPSPASGWDGVARVVLMVRAVGDYGRLMLYPSNLHMERTLIDGDNYRTTQSWKNSVRSEYLSILGLAMLAGLAAGSYWRGEGRTLRIFGAAWFLLAYLPISNIVELNATVAEHWLYLPSVGFLLFLAGCAMQLTPNWQRRLLPLTAIALVALSARSYLRSSDWVTPQTFYERTVAAGGTSTRVSVNLAQIYSAQGEYAKAEKLYRDILRILPDYPIARNNLADVLYQQGKAEEAGAMFAAANSVASETRKEYPRTWITVLNLARLRYQESKTQEAIALLEKARIDYPHNWDIISLQSEILRAQEGASAALPTVENFVRANWWHYPARLALGRIYAELGKVDEARVTLTQASRLDVHETAALNLIAFISVNANQLEKAFAAQRRAVGRQPDEPRQYKMLSDILNRMGRGDEAKLAMAKSVRLEAIAKGEVVAN